MIIDFQNGIKLEAQELMGGRVTVDGTEVYLVWYVDTEAGVIKTYDVLGDRKIHHRLSCSILDGTPVEFVGDLISKTVTGAVELFRPDGAKYMGEADGR